MPPSTPRSIASGHGRPAPRASLRTTTKAMSPPQPLAMAMWRRARGWAERRMPSAAAVGDLGVLVLLGHQANLRRCSRDISKARCIRRMRSGWATSENCRPTRSQVSRRTTRPQPVTDALAVAELQLEAQLVAEPGRVQALDEHAAAGEVDRVCVRRHVIPIGAGRREREREVDGRTHVLAALEQLRAAAVGEAHGVLLAVAAADAAAVLRDVEAAVHARDAVVVDELDHQRAALQPRRGRGRLLQQREVEEAGAGLGDAREHVLGLRDREQQLVADAGQQPGHGTSSRARSVADAGRSPASTAWPRAR